MSYGRNLETIFRSLAGFCDRMFKGEKIGDLADRTACHVQTRDQPAAHHGAWDFNGGRRADYGG
jgi:hypothetical protein